MRKFTFENGEHYHIYCRGVDKRQIFDDENDLARFIQSILEFNRTDTIGSIYERSFDKTKPTTDPIVTIISYCINPNHFHFVLRQNEDGGISKFIQKLLIGYTKYFNQKNGRAGPLFADRFKARHIDSDEYLLHLSVCVNLNFMVHGISLGNPMSKFVRSSWKQYSEELGGKSVIPCETDIILERFKNKPEYKAYAEEVLKDIIERRGEEKEESAEGLFEGLLGNPMSK